MKFLVIGAGSIGRRHIDNLRLLGIEAIAVFDPDRERVKKVEEESRVKGFSGLDEAFNDKPDAVLVCAPTSMHLSMARMALENGCHVFLEKPLSHSLDGIAELKSIARERSKQVVAVGYNMRFNVLFNQIKDWLESGVIGKVASARLHFGSYLPWRHPWEDYRVGYGAKKALGGGVILDAIHELDCALALFGLPQSVFCAAGKFGGLQIDVEDTAEIVLTYPEASEQVVSVHLDYLQRPHQRWAEIIGQEGLIYVDFVAGTSRAFIGESREWNDGAALADSNLSYVLEIEQFIECIETGAKPVVDIEVAEESLVLAMAAKQSAKEGRPVVVAGIATGEKVGA